MYLALPGTTLSEKAKLGGAVVASASVAPSKEAPVGPMYGGARLVMPLAITLGALPMKARKFGLFQTSLRSMPGVAGTLNGGWEMTNWSAPMVPVPKYTTSPADTAPPGCAGTPGASKRAQAVLVV